MVPWLARGGFRLGEHCEVLGSDARLAYSWSIAFYGEPVVAARKCRKTLSNMKLASGGWDQIFANTPLNRESQLYISPNKNKKREATQVLTKRLHALIESKLDPELGPLHALKPEGVFVFYWRPLCKVVPKADQTFDLYWNSPVLASTSLDKEDIIASMENRVSIRAGAVLWSL